MLTAEHAGVCHANGYSVVEDVVSPELLARLRRDCDGWVQDSRTHRASYGATADGRARLDLERGTARRFPACAACRRRQRSRRRSPKRCFLVQQVAPTS